MLIVKKPGPQHMPNRRRHYALSVHDGVTQWVPLEVEPETGGWLLGAGIVLLCVAWLVGAVMVALEAR